MLLSAIIPVYNEENTIREIVRRVREEPTEKEIIIVNDAPTDGTMEVLNGIVGDGITVVHHERNMGKGAAIRTAIQHVRGDIVVIQDADLEYDPAEYKRLIHPIEQNVADVVFGSRFIGQERRVLMFHHYVANRFLTLVSNIFTNLNLSDMETCYKVFRSGVLRKIDIQSNRFGFEPEITAKVAKMGCRIYEVPISYHGRDYSEGKKINWKDGLAAFWWIIRFNLLP
ncbi:MAG: glycosyltransferase family 2 protein [bacterium]